ncbi:MAG TPA: ABC transporter permease [Dehalococcoidia bacterium]|nr:ABC transporter permease [Dehalococcoidia bacterium]
MTFAVEREVLAETEERISHGMSPWGRTLRQLLSKRLAVACLAVILSIYVLGILAPWIAPYGYSEQNLDASFEGPSWEHWLGTDRTGRDTLSRNLFAARTTVIVTIATVATGSILLPLSLGLLAGYRGGWIDELINRVGEILASLPGLPMLLLIAVTLRPRITGWIGDVEGVVIAGWMKPGMELLRLCGTGDAVANCNHPLTDSAFDDYFVIFFVLSLFGWVGGMRLIRAQTLTLRDSEYVLAARASGASTARILYRHLLPNTLPLIVVGVSASLGAVAGSEIALTFLGVGIQPPGASFGALINDGASRIALEHHPELLLVPGIIVALLIFAFNLLGDAVNDVITPGAK